MSIKDEFQSIKEILAEAEKSPDNTQKIEFLESVQRELDLLIRKLRFVDIKTSASGFEDNNDDRHHIGLS